MEKTYHAQQAKLTNGDVSEYTWITVDGKEVTGCARGNHYAGCACGQRNRPANCTDEVAAECVRYITSMLDEKDAAEIRGAKFKERIENYDAEWEIAPGPGGWEIGWFICSNCGKKSAEPTEICAGCNSRMKKVY